MRTLTLADPGYVGRLASAASALFLAVGYNKAWTSPDGKAWTAQTVPAGSWYTAEFGNGLYVVGGYSASGYPLIYSADGCKTWTQVPLGTAYQFKALKFHGGLWVALVYYNGQNRVFTSTDLLTWTQRTTTGAILTAIDYGNGRWVGVGYGTTTGYYATATSLDGLTWSAKTGMASSSSGLDALAFGNGLWVACSGANVSVAIMTSPDGDTWTQRASGHGYLNAIAFGQGLFVVPAATNAYAHVLVSPDGEAWTQKAATGGAWAAAKFGAGLFVVVGNYMAPYVMTSPDGDQWTDEDANLGGGIYGLCFGGTN